MVVCRLLPPSHLIPTEELLSLVSLISRWEVVRLCIHWVVQNTKQYPVLIHLVFTLSAFFFFFSFQIHQGPKTAQSHEETNSSFRFPTIIVNTQIMYVKADV